MTKKTLLRLCLAGGIAIAWLMRPKKQNTEKIFAQMSEKPKPKEPVTVGDIRRWSMPPETNFFVRSIDTSGQKDFAKILYCREHSAFIESDIIKKYSTLIKSDCDINEFRGWCSIDG